MSRRNLVLGSAASLALVGAVLSAGPGFAQYRNSTPAEEAQTQALNMEQATAPTTVIIAMDDAAAPAYNAAIAEHGAAQSQYDAQFKDYQDKASAYEKQKQNYQQQLESYKGEHALYGAQSSDYTADVTAPPVVVEAPPAVVVAPPETTTVIVRDRLIDLHDLRDPDLELAGAPVEDRTGYLAGHLLHMTNQDGTEEAVIDLRDRNKKIVLRDEHLRFDPDAKVVVADLSLDELNRLPARF